MLGFESMCALTSEAIMLTGDMLVVTSCTGLGLDGRRPLRPFKLSVLTTAKGWHQSLLTVEGFYPSIATIHVELWHTHLPSPCPQLDTSGNGRTGIDSASSCPQDSPCWQGKRTWNSSVPYAVKYKWVLLEAHLKNWHMWRNTLCWLHRQARSCYLEKPFASLTGTNPVVLTGGVVPTHSTAALTPTWAF